MISRNIGLRPSQIAEIVLEALLYTGDSEMVGPGMGGVWLPDADSLYLEAVQDNTLLPTLGTK